ncbi:MAG: glutamine--fructose-6-phosphate transaminase (isomerizing) [Thermodesulfobacteriota bacterium]
MCGIFGYIGQASKTVEILLEGLKSLEYRGYDSSGIAVMEGSRARVVKSEGKLANLRQKLKGMTISGHVGMGHTRWATHGVASTTNAHPQVSGSTIVVHNGIIENYRELKRELLDKGYEFSSDTDTEVIAHLIEERTKAGMSLEEAVMGAFGRIEGSYAVVVMSEREPGKIIGIRKFSPLVLAVGDGEYFFASDTPAVLPYTHDVVFLEDGDMAVVETDGFTITDLSGEVQNRETTRLSWDPVLVEKDGYKHYMLKEIHEQPRAVLDTIRGRFNEESGDVHIEDLQPGLIKDINRIVLIACGTSYHACLAGRYMIEKLSRVPVEVDLASEFRYREPMTGDNTLVIAVSQSGETADTSEALLEAKRAGASTLAITNVINSKIARDADTSIHTHAGPEIGVASTKAFTTQLTVFYLLSVFFARALNKISNSDGQALLHDLIKVPKQIEIALKLDGEIRELAREFYTFNHFLFLGRGINYPIALEGALKLKEISYIHAEGYAAGEMKHGPIALVDENMPVVLVAPDDDVVFKKTLSNLQEIKTRRGKIILLTTDGNQTGLNDNVDRFITIPPASNLISPILAVVPLQLLAYHIASFKGTDIDQPRNLAKVVTVE